MNWILIALLAPLLLAISTFIDKFLVSKYFKGGQGALILYSCFIGLPIFILILIFDNSVLSIKPLAAILIILNSFLYISYLFPYFSALKRADASSVIPIFQTIPVFSYFLALVFLGETLKFWQIMASLLIIGGSIGISLIGRGSGKSVGLKNKIFYLMILASLFISLNMVFFKFFALEFDFWKTSFWQYVGIFLFGILLLIFKKSYRRDFINSIIKNKIKIVYLNAINEGINIAALIIVTFASLLAPLALVSVLNGLTPVFVFLIGLFLTLVFPHIIKENVEKKTLLLKIVFIIIIFIGGYLLNSFL